MNTLVYTGMLLVFLGFILIILGSIASMLGGAGDREAPKAGVRGGGIIMLGPIPILFGSDRGIVKTLLLIALILMAAYFLVPLLISFLLLSLQLFRPSYM